MSSNVHTAVKEKTMTQDRKLAHRRAWLGALACTALAAGGLAHAPFAFAQAPAPGGTTVRFLVPFAPGGGADRVARMMQNKLAEALGQPVVIENRPGAGITLASNIVAKAPPDGNTIIIVTIAHAVNPALYAELPYDSAKDFTPISMVEAQPMALVVNASVPANTLAEFIALAKAKPGTLNYSSPGNGSPTHISAELLKSMAGIDIVHVPYKGAAPATADLLGGQVQLTFGTIGVVQPHIKAGKLRALAVTSAKRSPVLPDVPTMAEAGVPGYEFMSWQALLAPGKLPPEIARKLNQATVSVLNSPEVKAALIEQGSVAMPTSLEEASRYIAAETARGAKLVKQIGARPD
jgi:tripartite-type tricarboxylate transporter receptor subunit TctC